MTPYSFSLYRLIKYNYFLESLSILLLIDDPPDVLVVDWACELVLLDPGELLLDDLVVKPRTTSKVSLGLFDHGG